MDFRLSLSLFVGLKKESIFTTKKIRVKQVSARSDPPKRRFSGD
jgi:hypothetical protein